MYLTVTNHYCVNLTTPERYSAADRAELVQWVGDFIKEPDDFEVSMAAIDAKYDGYDRVAEMLRDEAVELSIKHMDSEVTVNE